MICSRPRMNNGVRPAAPAGALFLLIAVSLTVAAELAPPSGVALAGPGWLGLSPAPAATDVLGAGPAAPRRAGRRGPATSPASATSEPQGHADSENNAPPANEAPTTTAASDEEPKLQYFHLPGRKMDVWGKIVHSETKLAGGLTGANQITINSETTQEKAADVVLDGERKSGIIQFACKRAQGSPLSVASLAVKDGTLNWTWNSIQPKDLKLDAFEEYIKGSMVQVFKDDKLVARFQSAPEELELHPGKKAALKLPDVPAALEVTDVAEPWSLSDSSTEEATLSANDTELKITLDGKAKTLQAETKLPSNGDIDDAKSNLQDIKKEAQQLLDKKIGLNKRPSSNLLQSEKDALDDEIKDNKKKQTEAEEELRKLRAKAGAAHSAAHTPAPKCRIRITYPNGVVAYDVKLKW